MDPNVNNLGIDGETRIAIEKAKQEAARHPKPFTKEDLARSMWLRTKKREEQNI